MSKSLNVPIDLIEQLENLTIHNWNFNKNEWSMWDVGRLRTIAKFIEREILINKKEEAT